MPSTSDNKRKRKADKAFQKDSDGTEPAPKLRRSVRLMEKNMSLTSVPEPVASTSAERRGTKRKADKMDIPEDEGTEPAPKHLKVDMEPEPSSSEDEAPLGINSVEPMPGLLFGFGASLYEEAVAGPSGINPEPHPVAFEEEDEGEDEMQLQVEDEEQPPEQDGNLARFHPDLSEGIPFNVRIGLDERISFRYEVSQDYVLGQDAQFFPATRRTDGCQVILKCVLVSPDDPHDSGTMKSYRHAVPGHSTPVFREIGMMLEMQIAPQPCPEIIHMLDWFQYPDGYIVVLERLSEPWVRLDNFIEENHGALRQSVSRDIILQLLRTFSFLVRWRVCHIAITAQHIMVNRETLELKLIGFGQSERQFFKDLEGDQSTVPYIQTYRYLWEMNGSYLTQLPELSNSMFGLFSEYLDMSMECLHFFESCLNPLKWHRMAHFLEHPWITDDGL